MLLACKLRLPCHATLLTHCKESISLYCLSAHKAEALGWVALQAREAKRRKREAEREAEKRKREAERRRRQQDHVQACSSVVCCGRLSVP